MLLIVDAKVQVLQEALARDKVEQEKQQGHGMTKSEALRSTSAFIQIIHKYRDYFVGNNYSFSKHYTWLSYL